MIKECWHLQMKLSAKVVKNKYQWIKKKLVSLVIVTSVMISFN